MNLRLSILTLFRSPVKTLITFMLLVTTSFLFVSRGMEYLTTEQVVTAAEQEYVAVGTLVATEKKYEEFYKLNPAYEQTYGSNLTEIMEAFQYFCPIDEEALDLILSTDYIQTSEVRHVAGGITSGEYKTVFEHPVGFDSVLFGQLALDNVIVIARSYTTTGEPDKETGRYRQDQAYIKIEEVLVGHEDIFPVGATPEYSVDVETGKQYPRDIYTTFRIGADYLGDAGSFGKLIKGHRYIIALSPDGSTSASNSTVITPGIPYNILDLTLLEEKKGSPVTYEDYAYFLEDHYAATMEVNHRKQELVYTSDMSLMPRFHDGTLYMTEGRMITPEDDGYVCVINAEYAKQNGIEVGDSIDFDIDPNTMVYCGEVLAREVYEPYEFFLGEKYADYELEQERRSYEVVGIWAAPPQEENNSLEDLVDYGSQEPYADSLVYALNTVFVPEATYPWPDDVEPHSFPATFSFELKHPRYARNLEVELGDKLEAMGYKLVINDLGYSDVETGFTTLRIGAFIGLISMGVALLFSLVLITYIFIVRRKSEFAIMRALGVPSTRASCSLLVGLCVLAAPGVAIGSGAAMITIHSYASDLALSVAELAGGSASVTFSPWLAAVIGIGVLVVLLIFAAIGLRTVGKKPPLELLQDQQ